MLSGFFFSISANSLLYLKPLCFEKCRLNIFFIHIFSVFLYELYH